MTTDTFYLVGRDGRSGWIFGGVAPTRQQALACCRRPGWFIAPARLAERHTDYTPPMGEREYPHGREEGGVAMSAFGSRFGFGANVTIARSGERGRVSGVAFYQRNLQPMYFVEYTSADGRAVESWFHDDELVEVES